jgi:hypothetical protein
VAPSGAGEATVGVAVGAASSSLSRRSSASSSPKLSPSAALSAADAEVTDSASSTPATADHRSTNSCRHAGGFASAPQW